MVDRRLAANEADAPRVARRGVARRGLLVGLLTTSSLSLMPWAAATPAAAPDSRAFMALSAMIVGPEKLSAQQGERLFTALVADDPGFPAAAGGLLALLQRQPVAPLALQDFLDKQAPQFAHVPRTIMTAWWMGVVGSGAKARCLAYEHALNAILVADVLKPPTYAYGTYGSWTAPPLGSAPPAKAPAHV